ncbi:MAG TPA: CRISPR-associated endonuclease Cas2 [Anaerolineales bacterium]|nr:CRISPR-associated endonuclease Cas2 [Anaerolineales bacterium]
MHCLLVYDIPDDRIRIKVADFCLDYGLDRIQYSAFVGRLSRNHMEELMQKIRAKIGKAPAKVLLIPIPADAWEERLEHVQEKPGTD